MKRYRPALSILLGSLIILLPAIINGYPFVFSDTGTYIRSAFEGYVPVDRPYWYGAFMRLTSGRGTSLWGVAAMQALLCAIYIHRSTRLLLGPDRAARRTLIVTAILTATTGLGWYAGQLIPDIFTALGVLALWSFLRNGGRAWIRACDALVVAGACWMHLSNLIILPLTGVVILLVLRASLVRRAARLAAVTVLAWGGLAFANYTLEGEAYLSKAGHVFFLGHMVDTGMLRPYLEEHCPTEHFGICAYMDSLPTNSEAFLWWPDSPVAEQGGWLATRAEYGRIMRGSLTEPRFLWWHVRGSVASTCTQLVQWDICKPLSSHWYRGADSPPYQMVEKHLPRELPAYRASLQNGGRGELHMRGPDLVYRGMLLLSLIVGAWSLWRGRNKAEGAEARALLIVALAAVVIGAWACATLSVVDSRYLGRDEWLIPMAAILAVWHPLMARRSAAVPASATS